MDSIAPFAAVHTDILMHDVDGKLYCELCVMKVVLKVLTEQTVSHIPVYK